MNSFFNHASHFSVVFFSSRLHLTKTISALSIGAWHILCILYINCFDTSKPVFVFDLVHAYLNHNMFALIFFFVKVWAVYSKLGFALVNNNVLCSAWLITCSLEIRRVLRTPSWRLKLVFWNVLEQALVIFWHAFFFLTVSVYPRSSL